MSGDDRTAVRTAFREALNMTKRELERWLDGDESRSVGVTDGGGKKTDSGGGELVGHESGRHIQRILDARRRSSPTATTPTCGTAT
jgi:hypothetical protein